MVEAAVIMIGVVALLAVLTLHQDVAGTADPSTAHHHRSRPGRPAATGPSCSGPGFMASFNAVLFGTLLYRSRLVPRIIPTIGLVGAPLLFTANMLALFGHATPAHGWAMIATLPIATWELSVGFYMTFKGFRRTPYTQA